MAKKTRFINITEEIEELEREIQSKRNWNFTEMYYASIRLMAQYWRKRVYLQENAGWVPDLIGPVEAKDVICE